jgi:peptidoglycan/xylan/chitin deacetylase (PgdA/CDA1 family)
MSPGVFTLTFDDASRSQLERGLPILAEHDVRGVMFAPTGLLGGWFEREPLLDLDGLRALVHPR